MLAEFLALSTMTLATSGADGAPHAAPVYFAAGEGMRLYFFSDIASQHSRDLAYNPHAAVAIYPECRGWQEIRGLQLRGAARAVADAAERRAAWRIYRAKFPFVRGLQAAVTASQLYLFTPRWARLTDNRRGFGFKEEWELS
ncbi:MAG: pyridoxamine 5'-phosphate oxidase family protein [Chloroflexi bacterium]|nr:pyridoxamine 5'-phosphate oxidase family protein [Chloroflexota bacterium]